jgi:hypothetical protein
MKFVSLQQIASSFMLPTAKQKQWLILECSISGLLLQVILQIERKGMGNFGCFVTLSCGKDSKRETFQKFKL